MINNLLLDDPLLMYRELKAFKEADDADDKDEEEENEEELEETEETDDELEDEEFGDDFSFGEFPTIPSDSGDSYEEPVEEEEDTDDDFWIDPIENDEVMDLDVPEEVKPVQKINTVDALTKAMDKFERIMSEQNSFWMDLATAPDKRKLAKKELQNWDYIEDIYKLVNRTLGNYDFEYIKVYNELYDKIMKSEWKKGLDVYSKTNYGKPFITEGLYLLMYELSFDWACFMVKWLINNPDIDASNFENDSFVKQFPDLSLRTYIAHLLVNSEEFSDFMSNKEAFKLIDDSNEYNLTFKQVQDKPDLLSTAGESLTYYVNLVQNDYADILVGVLDKLASIVYLSNNCKYDFNKRLGLIRDLIISSVSQGPVPVIDPNNNRSEKNMLSVLNNEADTFLLARTEARYQLNSMSLNINKED